MNLTLLPALLLIIAALSGTIVVQLVSPAPDGAYEVTTPRPGDLVRPAPTIPSRKPVEAWATTALARPLFQPDRRPVVVVAAVPASSRALPRLTGLIVGPFGRKAIFAGANGGSKVVAEGETLESWTVKSITSGSVVVAGSDGERALTLVSGPRPPIAIPAAIDEHESGQMSRRPLTDPIWPPLPSQRLP